MADRLSKEQRSKLMKAVKGKNTLLEAKVTKALWHKGVRFRKNVKSLIGKPDIAIKKLKLVVFLDSCFWHGCPIHCKVPKSNVEFWKLKIDRNIKRDLEVTRHYREIGWDIIRIWEHELKDNFEGEVNKIIDIIKERTQAKKLGQ
ncbi:very short patch repair endonuclease [Paenibacillus chitinolyticus]|uniref:very short patch repair endonuclease n=1 Tax=Paenibacillus chitinolyticus TaxID=79263 RepID=UPI003670E93E